METVMAALCCMSDDALTEMKVVVGVERNPRYPEIVFP